MTSGSARRLFGTDGVRGLAGGDVLTADLALRLAASAGRELGSPGGRVAIGRDTRPSGPMLVAAAAAGFASVGLDVDLLGVVPTPAVAHAVASGAADLGLVVSASHNPAADNGLKLFGAGGHKLSDATEAAIEAGLGITPTGTAIGHVRVVEQGAAAYLEHLLAAAPTDLSGLKVVVDCAEGAASAIAPEAYRRAGAEVVAIFADGDGSRINDGCGATHLEALQAAVVEHGAHLGLAHDGDADRCLAVDASGAAVDGDQLLAICALALQAGGGLAHDTVVATVMSNLGFVQAMQRAGIAVVSTAVGDRYVLEAMLAGGFSVGGEQSGHLVLLDHATTGDGVLTGLTVLQRMAQTGATLAELAGVVVALPQVLVNVRADRSRATAPDVVEAVAKEEADLGGDGRVLLRPSGTEALVRVMVEAPTDEQARAVAERLARVVGA